MTHASTHLKAAQWPSMLARLWIALLPLVLATGCSTQLLGSLTAAALTSSQTAAAQDRAEQNALAANTAVTEKSPEMETEATYLQVIAHMQHKQLWFASLAHLDALESKWKVSDDSRLLRADALRHAGMSAESTRLYQQLLVGQQSARARHGLGLLAARDGRYSESVKHLQAARALSPTDALLLNDLAYALMHTEQAESARIPLMQAAQLQPNNQRIQSNVALFLLLYGSSEQAADWMRQYQMSETMRLQVFAQAQRLATAAAQPTGSAPQTKSAPEAASTPTAPPPSASAAAPVDTSTWTMPPPPTKKMAALSPERIPVWMTESPHQGAKP